jgi:hypothetical protein
LSLSLFSKNGNRRNTDKKDIPIEIKILTKIPNSRTDIPKKRPIPKRIKMII